MNWLLVVDDEEQILRALRRALDARGYDVVTAPGRRGGLAEVERSMPDLVVLDLNLPGISGFEVRRRLRGWSEVLILILSVREDEAGKVRRSDLGADDYLTSRSASRGCCSCRAVRAGGPGPRAAPPRG